MQPAKDLASLHICAGLLEPKLLDNVISVKSLCLLFVSGCDPTDLVLVPNATTALNTVIRSIPFQKGDVIFCLSVTYGKPITYNLSIIDHTIKQAQSARFYK